MSILDWKSNTVTTISLLQDGVPVNIAEIHTKAEGKIWSPGGQPSTAPDAFDDVQWSVANSPSPTGDRITFNIASLPYNGGSAVTVMQYQVNALGWIDFSNKVPGLYTVPTGLGSGVAVNTMVRVVNNVGAGPDSDIKSVTPTVLNVPDPFLVGMWSVADSKSISGDQIAITITGLPFDGGSPITAIQYQVNALSWINLSDFDADTYIVPTGLGSGVAVDVKVRAVNAVGVAPNSDIKNVAPTAFTVPAAYTVNQWNVVDYPSGGGDRVTFSNTLLPDNGGSPITSQQYQIDSDPWVTFPGPLSGVGVGSYEIVTGKGPGVAVTAKVRAVNAIGAAANSDTKNVTPTVADVPPSVFTNTMWSVADKPSATADQMTITITILPYDGGSPITDLEYAVDGTAWISLGDVTTGAYNVPTWSPATQQVGVMVRAVNVIGNGPDSLSKSVIPTYAVSAGDVTYVGPSAVAKQVGLAGSVDLTTIAGLAPDDLVLLYIAGASNAGRTTHTADAGWAAVSPQIVANDNYDHSSCVYWKIMGSPVDTIVNIAAPGSGSTPMICMAKAYRDFDPAQFQDIAVVKNSGINSVLVNPIAFTPITVGARAVIFGGGARVVGLTDTYVTLPGLIDTIVDHNASASYSHLFGTGDYVWSAGAIDPAIWTGPVVTATDAWGCWNIILRPIPGTGASLPPIGGAVDLHYAQ